MKIFTITFPASSIPDIELNFNNDSFSWYDIEDQMDKENSQEYVAFLPGIKIKKKLLYKIPFLLFFKSIFSNHNFTLAEQLIELIIFKSSNIELTFHIFNRRDSILLKSKDEIIYSNSLHFEDQSIIDLFNTPSTQRSELITKYKWIMPQNILYPFTPGGGGNRCAVLRLFHDLGLTDRTYNFFLNHEVFYSTATDLEILSLCENFQHCAAIQKAFKEGSYIWPTEKSHIDNLSVVENNGVFKISNANHRICCAKRFNVPRIYARVILSEHSYFENRSSPSPASSRYSREKNTDILKDFNCALEKLHLKQCDGDYILEHGLRGTALLHFIKATTGKSLIQLAQQDTHD